MFSCTALVIRANDVFRRTFMLTWRALRIPNKWRSFQCVNARAIVFERTEAHLALVNTNAPLGIHDGVKYGTQ